MVQQVRVEKLSSVASSDCESLVTAWRISDRDAPCPLRACTSQASERIGFSALSGLQPAGHANGSVAFSTSTVPNGHRRAHNPHTTKTGSSSASCSTRLNAGPAAAVVQVHGRSVPCDDLEPQSVHYIWQKGCADSLTGSCTGFAIPSRRSLHTCSQSLGGTSSIIASACAPGPMLLPTSCPTTMGFLPPAESSFPWAWRQKFIGRRRDLHHHTQKRSPPPA